MIRALTLSALLSACSYDATLGQRLGPEGLDGGVGAIDAQRAVAFTIANAGGPILAAGETIYSTTSYSDVGDGVPDSHLLVTVGPEHVAVVHSGAIYAYYLAEDDATVFAIGAPPLAPVNIPSSTLTGIDRTTGETTTIAVGLDYGPIAVTDSALFIAAKSGDVVRVDKTTHQIARFATGFAIMRAIAVDDHNLYVTDTDHGAIGGRFVALPLSGGDPLVLASDVPNLSGLLVAGDWIYFCGAGVANDINSADGVIGRVPRPASGATQAGAVTMIATGLGQATSLAVDSRYVYTTSANVGLQRVPLDGGSGETVFPAGIIGSYGLALSGEVAMFSARYPDNTSGLIYAVHR